MSDNEDSVNLHNEYQYLEQTKIENTRDSTQILTKQQALIEQYKKDNEQLKRDCRAFLRKPRGQIAENVLTRLNDQEFQCEKRIIIEKRNIDEFNGQIDALRDRIRSIKSTMGGINHAIETSTMADKQVQILENRLEKSLSRFNEALSYNRDLRDKIDILRRERVVCDGIHKNMERNLHEKEKKAADLIEKANENYTIRDEARIELSNIEQLNNQEHLEFEQRILDYDKEDEFLAYMEDHKYDNADKNKNKNYLNEEESWILEDDNANDTYQIPDLNMRIDAYKDSFYKIMSATGIENMDILVETFIKNEDKNFSLFNFISSQATDIEVMEEGILKLKDEENEINEDGGSDLNQNEQLKKDLSVQLEIIHSRCEKFERKFQESSRTYNQLKKLIHELFDNIKCDEMLISELLKDSDITETNIMQFLGIIEQKSCDILRYFKTYADKSETTKEGPKVPKMDSSNKIKMIIPTVDEYNSKDDNSDDELPQPQDLDKIKEDIIKQIGIQGNLKREIVINKKKQ